MLPEAILMIWPKTTPPAVPAAKATRPRQMISIVSRRRNLSPDIVKPVPVARKMVTILISAFCAVSDSLAVTPDTSNRFPMHRQPISAATGGRSRDTTMATTIGNTTFSKWLTGRRLTILIFLCSLVVISFIIGGWMSGTRDI